MRLLLVPWVLSLGACLPAYDNQSSAVTQTDAGTDGAMAVNPCTTATAKKISGAPFLIDHLASVSGPVLRIEGCTGDPGSVGVSNKASSSIAFTVIPAAYLNGTPRYLILEGMYDAGNGNAGNVLRNWMAPRIVLDGGNRLINTTFHFSSDMNGVRGEIAKELAAAGRIPITDGVEAKFGLLYTFAFGSLGFQTEPVNEVANTTFSIDDDTSRDEASCNPASTCCVYYSNAFDEFFTTPQKKATLLDLTATKSPSGFFAIVCPVVPGGTEPPELKITQTATTLTDKLSNFTSSIPATTSSPFPPFMVPRKAGEAVTIENYVTQ